MTQRLRNQIQKLNKQLYALENAKRYKQNKKKVGKFYKYSNSYSDGDRWWLYLAVTDIMKNGELIGWSFELTSDDKVNIDMHDYCHLTDMSDEIVEDEFIAEWDNLIEYLRGDE